VEQGRGCRAEAKDNASETDEPICVQGQSETGSAVNGQCRPRCYIPMESTLGKRKREMRKSKGMMKMRQMSWETCLLCLFSYFRVSEKERVICRGEELARIG